MNDSLHIRAALPADAGAITAVALRSKAHWGYSKEFMDACADELSVTPKEINSPSLKFFVAESNNTILGYYAIGKTADSEDELEALFVDSDQIGTGVGRALMDHAKYVVRKSGGQSIVLQSDPNAAKFYRAAGGEQIGQRESGSIPGRMLPVFRILIAGAGT